jgi:hypothetical protein
MAAGIPMLVRYFSKKLVLCTSSTPSALPSNSTAPDELANEIIPNNISAPSAVWLSILHAHENAYDPSLLHCVLSDTLLTPPDHIIWTPPLISSEPMHNHIYFNN